MQFSQITLTTTADGKENTVTHRGKMSLTDSPIRLTYTEEGASVGMEIDNDCVRLIRKGDYELELRLEKGKKSTGKIGFGGSFGDISTFTHSLALSQKEDAILLTLRYDLLISGEIQQVKLRLYAKYI